MPSVNYTFQELKTIFALAGKTLTMAELQTAARALSNFLPRYADTTSAGNLRSDIDHLISANIVKQINNTFSYQGDDLTATTIDFLSEPTRAAASTALGQALPFVRPYGGANLDRLLQYLRNSFMAKDVKNHKRLLENLQKYFPKEYALGTPYQFILNLLDTPWFQNLPPELLSFCACHLIPSLILDFKQLNPILDIVLPKRDKLYGFALYAIFDALILQGRIEEAEQLFGNESLDAVQTRKAWLLFQHGNYKEAIAAFSNILAEIRSSSYRTDYYFTAITGIIYIFALLRQGTPKDLVDSFEYSKLGHSNPLWSPVYELLNNFIQSLIYKDSFHFTTFDNAPPNAFTEFFSFIIDYWRDPLLFANTRTAEIIRFRNNVATNGYKLIEAECNELLARLDAAWIPSAPSPVAFWAKHRCESLLLCHDVLPPWTIKLNKIKSIIIDEKQKRMSRLAWILEPAPSPAFVSLKLLEQQLTKTGKWTKGHAVNVIKLIDEVEDNQHEWPSHFTTQDIHVISLIHDLEMLANLHGSGLYELNFNSLAPLYALVGHPNLYWSEKEEMTHVTCCKAVPFIRMTEIDGCLRLSLHPANPQLKQIIPAHESTELLNLYVFSQIQLHLLKTIGGSLLIPLAATREIHDSCLALRQHTDILSDVPLDDCNFTFEDATPTPVLNLEFNGDTLMVELLCKPFQQLDQFCAFNSGPIVFIPASTDNSPCFRRNFQTENELITKILSLCPQLTSDCQTTPMNWRLRNRNYILELLLKLNELSDFIIVRWKYGKRLKVTNKIGVSNLHIAIHHKNDWFELDGDVKINDRETISFRRLLELASQQKGNFITLDDGQILALANDFKRQLDDFNTLGNFDENGNFIFDRFAVPAAQILLEDRQINLSDKPSEWLRQLDEINRAMNMKPDIPQNLSPDVKLRKYQVDGFQWLTRLDAWGAGACLADDMGLGKTIQVLTFILSKADEGPSLVVAPTTVCQNWLEQCQRFTPSLKTVVFGQGNRQETLAQMGPSSLLVVSYGLLQSEIEAFQKVRWRIVVLDEAQAIKNFQAKRSQAVLKLDAQFKIVTTGTPLENNLGELWTLFQFITPGLLKSRLYFMNRFASVNDNEKDGTETERLARIVKPFLLRRRKDQVLKELPPKTEIPFFVELSEKERSFYEAVRRKLLDDINQDIDTNSPQNRIRIIAAITKLRQAACNARLVEPTTDIPSAKLEAFVQLVQNLVAANHKALVFSQFVRHLDIIRPVLDNLGISYQYLDGSTPRKDRTDAVDAFQKGSSDLFLISLKAGGLGLNLTRADFVILLDPWWNPAVEDQASDRAHRIGQTKPVTIYRLIAKNTIEEKIIALHNEKRDLAEKILSGADTPTTITAEELLRLIAEQ